MSTDKNIRALRGSARFAGSTDKDVGLQAFLESDKRNLIEGDRNLVLNLQDQFNFERQYSTTYRLYGKIDMLYHNVISGETTNANTIKNMYFIPDFRGCPDCLLYPGPFCGPPCSGLPPAVTFDMIPNRRYGPGGGAGIGPFNFATAYQDNWVLYTSYIYSHQSGQTMQFHIDYTGGTSGLDFVAGDGIPFTLETVVIDGKDTLRFRTRARHGIQPGEYIEIQSTATSFGGANLITTIPLTYSLNLVPTTRFETIFKIDSFGDGTTNSEDYVLNVNVKGIDSGTIPSKCVGTFKRIINIDNIAETKSQYYVHQHKLISRSNDYTLDRTGFEFGIYNRKGRNFSDKKTPDSIAKTVIKEEFKSYVYCFTRDFDAEKYFDNWNRPVSEFYLTMLPTNRNAMWDYEGDSGFAADSPATYGWNWNFQPNGFLDPFIDIDTLPHNKVNLFQSTPTNGVDPLPTSGATFRGAFVEWNPYEIKERIISEIGHALKLNPTVLVEGVTTQVPPEKHSIYKYKPHHRILIRPFSNTINYSDSLENSPQYARYLVSEETFRWRNQLPVEMYEDNGYGVSYPYLNDAHYPHLSVEFKHIPVGPILNKIEPMSAMTMLNEMIDVC